MTVLEYKG